MDRFTIHFGCFTKFYPSKREACFTEWTFFYLKNKLFFLYENAIVNMKVGIIAASAKLTVQASSVQYSIFTIKLRLLS